MYLYEYAYVHVHVHVPVPVPVHEHVHVHVHVHPERVGGTRIPAVIVLSVKGEVLHFMWKCSVCSYLLWSSYSLRRGGVTFHVEMQCLHLFTMVIVLSAKGRCYILCVDTVFAVIIL